MSSWVGPTMESYLESRVNDMILLDGLPTLPAKQGKGYASALVRPLHSMVRAPDFIPPTTLTSTRTLGIVVEADEQGRWVSPCGGDVDGRRQPIVDGWTCARGTGGFITVL